MEKALVLYDSKYGNTKILAEKIAEAIGEKQSIQPDVVNLQGFDKKKIEGYDTVLIGSPNHFGRESKNTKRFIKNLGDINLEGKRLAVFDTCFRAEVGKASRKMEKRIQSVNPGAQFVSPGLSVIVDSAKGPIAEGEFAKCMEFVDRIAQP
ncbi:MAG: flavodoxin family protein [Methanobacteriota archaeon]|nr:MAG: flavodoxin family protein [Euryarchaeota archaeon]